jgi:hypothetical protein
VSMEMPRQKISAASVGSPGQQGTGGRSATPSQTAEVDWRRLANTPDAGQ